jgi:hypothetical protein
LRIARSKYCGWKAIEFSDSIGYTGSHQFSCACGAENQVSRCEWNWSARPAFMYWLCAIVRRRGTSK